MRLLLACSQCYFNTVNEDEFIVEFRDDGLYELTCPRGHRTISIIRQLKFEILSTIGVFAIRDGYYREAVSSFASCLERFYEFYIRTMSIQNGSPSEAITEAWKSVANQSERQLGAYIFLYTNNHKSSPILLSNNDVKFRNEVIHKGKIPTKEEAIKFGNSILNLIRPVLFELKSNYRDSIDQVISGHLQPAWDRNTTGFNVTTVSTPTVICIDINDERHNKKTIEDFLADISSV